MAQIWFKRKKYGWGWRPVTIQGWVVVIAYCAANVFYFLQINGDSNSGSDTLLGFLPIFLFLTALLVLICYKMGEKPRWSWGDAQPVKRTQKKKPSKRKK